MKNFIFLLFFCFLPMPVLAYSSEASRFTEKEYAVKNNCEKVQINMKKEFRYEYNLKTDKKTVCSVAYGWGDLKAKDCKKRSISYLVTFDENKKPLCSFVNFHE